MPFEIIEIGAVKLGENREIEDTFRALIRPVLYKKLHFQTKKVVGLTNEDLKKGRPFAEAADDFFKWCGEDFRFCTWGPADLTELQRNLAFHGMSDRIRGPLIYEDVQKLYAIMSGNRKNRKALSAASEELGITADGDFHFAKTDALYTAKVLQRIPEDIVLKNYSVDCFQIPASRAEELHLRFDTYDKYVSRGFPTKEELLANEGIRAVRCVECGKNARRVVRWFPDGSGRNYHAAGRCAEHGLIKCKLRVRESGSGQFYAVRTTKRISEEDLEKLRGRQSHVFEKRHNKRKK